MQRPALKTLAKTAVPCSFLLFELLVFHRAVLFSRAAAIPFDLRGYHLPLAFFAAENLGLGRLPLWDPYVYCGFPFYANIGTQLFYPFAWPFFALANLLGLNAMGKLLDWQVVLHVWLGGLGAYWLLRRMRLDRGAAVLGATIYQLGGYFTSQLQHLGAVCGAAWLPMAWLAVLTLAERFSWRWTALLAGALAMSLLAGFPATAIVVFGSCLLLAILLVLLRRAPLSLLASTASACVWAALVSAVQLLPTIDLTGRSLASLRAKWYVAGGLPLQALVSLVLPNHYYVLDHDRYSFPFNITFMYLYCSVAGLLLALAGAFFSKHKLGIVFVVLTLVCCAGMVSSNLPLIGGFYSSLPAAVRSAMYPEFAMAAFILGIAVLAALGAQRFVARWGRVATGTLVLAIAVDLTATGSHRFMNTAWVKREHETTTRKFEGSDDTLTRMRELTGQMFPRARLDTIHASRNWTSAAQILRLPTANGNEPLALLRVLKLRRCFASGGEHARYSEVTNFDSKLPDLLNIKYLLAYEGSGRAPAHSRHLPRLEDLGSYTIYENTGVLPRFFLVGEVRRARDFDESLAAVCAPAFEPAREAVVEDAGEFRAPAVTDMPGSVNAVRYSPNEVVLDVDARAPSFLVTSETFYPGWRAAVNGRPERIRITNAAFRGLPVPAGRSRVTMSFRPPDLIYGALLSALAGIALAWAAVRKSPA